MWSLVNGSQREDHKLASGLRACPQYFGVADSKARNQARHFVAMETAIPFAILCLIILFALFINIFIITVIAKRKRLHTDVTLPSSIIYAFLCAVDVVGACTWTFFTALTYFNGFVGDNDFLCRMQVVIMFLCNLLNGHVLTVLMFERFLKIFKPSKHTEIYFDLVIVLFLIAITVFDAVVASFPAWELNFGEITYFADQGQCSVDFSFSESHFRLTIIMHFAIPVGLILIFYVATLIRLCHLKKHRAPNGDIIVEENMEVRGDSYSDRLKAMYARFQDSRSTRPAIKDEREGYNNDGYHSDEDNFNSDDEKEDAQESRKGQNERRVNAKKTHYLTKSDVWATHMYALMSLVYFALWTPYLAWIILFTYYYYDTRVSSDAMMVFVVLSHLGACAKAPFYLLSERMRTAIKKTLGMEKKGADGKYLDDYDAGMSRKP